MTLMDVNKIHLKLDLAEWFESCCSAIIPTGFCKVTFVLGTFFNEFSPEKHYGKST